MNQTWRCCVRLRIVAFSSRDTSLSLKGSVLARSESLKEIGPAGMAGLISEPLMPTGAMRLVELAMSAVEEARVLDSFDGMYED